jgi:hypothetical protein
VDAGCPWTVTSARFHGFGDLAHNRVVVRGLRVAGLQGLGDGVQRLAHPVRGEVTGQPEG